jgi:quercetin dioxygenase-like cupin family protein
LRAQYVIGIDMNLKHRILAAAAAAALLTTLGLASGAMASPPTGTVTAGPATSGQLDGDRHDRVRASQDGIRLKTRVPASVSTFELTYEPNSQSGWHSHQGIVVVVVKSGSVVRQTPCDEPEVFTVGDAFTEVGSHNVSNPSGTPAVLSITRILPTEDVGEPRIEDRVPTCRHH